MPVTIEVVIDEDDATMNASDVLQRLDALDCIVTVGKHRSKIEAVNGGVVFDWDILVLASDDMMPVSDGYAVTIAKAMEQHFPHLDGMIFFDDGYAHERCCTLPIFGRRLYDQFGYVYEPCYKSLCCDLEQTELLRAMGRIVYIDQMIIEHQHPANDCQKFAVDTLYARNEKLHGRDHQLYESRKERRRQNAQFPFDAPPLVLSILIAHSPSRKVQLERLMRYLYGQVVRDAPREVEILVENGQGRHIGAVRQALLEHAKGHYIAFVDDDDWVSHDYVQKIVVAIRSTNYTADCCSLWGRITQNGNKPESFHHSLEYDRWYTSSEGIYCRTPNHLNAIRRELAIQAGFPLDSSFGEDHEFANKVKPLLKKEAKIDSVLYHYWFWAKPSPDAQAAP